MICFIKIDYKMYLLYILYISMSILVIVESPGKNKTIKSILGDKYIVKACFGHCRDLDSSSLSIDVDNNFEPKYSILKDKQKIVKDLIFTASKCDKVILATDEDREGEMIASSLRDILKLKNPERIVFHSITKSAIMEAINNPTKINENMVMAQQARRLLDRLVGYKISPLLWKQLQGKLSAGRVQSVVVKIIIDKENEINNFMENNTGSFYKTTGDFTINDINVKSTLMIKEEIYKIDNPELFLSKINKKSKFQINDIIIKEVLNKPSKPFITSTLQQEAYTKYGFNSKRTMGVAQKLYEAGYITYMRTDSHNLSKDILFECKNYIVNKYGENYYNYRTFTNKGNAQEAHEAIRPTKIDRINIEMTDDCNKLYELIWKRTICSQMADAIITQNNIYIDIVNTLPDNVYFKAIIESIKFNGYLIVYGKDNENNISINKKDNIIMDNINISQNYSQPPLRYNEAGLIKYLEKNGIGRPSTYASIMDKIITREYVKIQNIDGVEKESKQYKMNKNFKIKETVKNIKVGNEKKKLVPTQIGIDTNNFMVTNFDNIMQVDFTANFEKLLDDIAIGKIKWYNVLEQYYKQFNPIVEKLIKEKPKKSDKTDVFIGEHNGNNYYSMIGKYGLCVKMVDSNEKYTFSSVKDVKQEDITLDMAIKLLEYPKLLGLSGKSEIYLNKGPYGFYFQKGKNRVSVKDENRKEDLSYAIELFDTEPGAIKTFKVKNQKVFLKKGQYGYYLQYNVNGKKVNKSLPNNIDIEKLNVIDIIKK